MSVSGESKESPREELVDKPFKVIEVEPQAANILSIRQFFEQFKRNPRELDGLVLENFIRECIADEVRQLRIQTNDNTKDFNIMRHQFVQDRIKINNCDRSVKTLMKKQKEREEDPL